MSQVLFCTKEDIVRRSPILNGDIDSDKIIPALHISQTQYLREIIGTDLYNYYDTAIRALPGTPIPTNHKTLLDDYIKPILIHLCTAEFLKSGAYIVSNKGIYKSSSENSEAASAEEVKELVQIERDRAQSYTERFLDYMAFNATTKGITQWFSNSNDDVSPNYESYTIDWVI
jgi:hypothetical protein